MIYFPITLSVVLGSSLIVAIFFNSMLVSQFMEISEREISTKSLWRLTFFMGGLGILLLFGSSETRIFGNLMVLVPVLFWLYKFFIKKWATSFQKTFLVKMENAYRKLLRFALSGVKPYLFLGGTFLLLFFSFTLMGIFPPQVEFFPDNQPKQILVFIEYPEGTAIAKTNRTTRKIEEEILSVISRSEYNKNGANLLVESMVAQVGEGSGNPTVDNGNTNELPHKGKITLTMQEFKYRDGVSSESLRKAIQEQLFEKFPGVAISVEKDANGPPAGYPITIEITGAAYLDLIQTAEQMKDFLNRVNVSGVEELKIDVNKNKPGTQLQIDRKKAGELGVSASQVGQLLRTSLFGSKAGIYKKFGDDYDINVRFDQINRYDNNALFNQNIIFRDPANGRIKEIPVAALVTQKNITSFNAIKHRELNRVVTLYSSVLAGYNANEVVEQVKNALNNFQLAEGINFKFSGEIEEQEKNMTFLSNALAAALGLILLLLVFQFNSISKPLIILLSIFLSFTGVFLGLMIFQMPFVILMTMMGIIALAGIVVNNGVVLLDYTQLLIDRKHLTEELDSGTLLSKELAIPEIIEGGAARLRPVILTAITTVLGLIPLAIGLNIDFFSMFSEWDPKIYIGGDNVIFWGPLAWTVIFGLTFATFLTLVIVPATFTIVYSIKLWLKKIL
jgi:multidrug efflux pump subunit AcrB